MAAKPKKRIKVLEPGLQAVQSAHQTTGMVFNRITELRIRSRLTMAELAKLIDRSVATVSRHESGDKMLNEHDIHAYAQVFKIATYELFQAPPTKFDAWMEKHTGNGWGKTEPEVGEPDDADLTSRMSKMFELREP